MVRRAITRAAITRADVIAVTVLVLVGAVGFSTPALFPEPVIAGGGGGRFFTGSPRDGFGCDVCHEGGVAPSIVVDGLPAAWGPGLTYTIDLRWSVSSGSVALVGEVVDAMGEGVGSLATPPRDLLEDDERCAGGNPAARLLGDFDRAREVFAIPACGAERTRVQWQAPQTDVGSVWLHLGVVHGDDSDAPDGDGVRMMVYEIPSTGSIDASQGCRAGEGPRRSPWLLLLLVGAWWRRRCP